MAGGDRKLLHIEVGPVQIDVPQTVGYYGGIGAALAVGLLEPPLAAFVAVLPLIKILAEHGWPIPVRFVAEILQGAAKPLVVVLAGCWHGLRLLVRSEPLPDPGRFSQQRERPDPPA